MMAQMEQMQKMMLWMLPLMIGFFTATFPAAVGIYWLTSTVFGIGQQKLVNWQLDKPQVRRKD
jgi:YidC/Oxa1 family membrane protein insertase